MNKNKTQTDNNLFNELLQKITTEKIQCPVKAPYCLESYRNYFIFKKTLPFEILSPVTGTLTFDYSTENFNQIIINVKNKYELIFEVTRKSPELKIGKEILKNQYIGECKNKLVFSIKNLQEKKNKKCPTSSAPTEE